MTDVTFKFFDVGESFHVSFFFFLYVHSDELKQQWETSVAQDRAAMENVQAKEIQVKLCKCYTNVERLIDAI